MLTECGTGFIAALLFCECSELLPSRQESLVNTLAAAAHQMGIDDRQRSGPGPPPLLIFRRCLPLPEPLRPQELQILPAAARGKHHVVGDMLHYLA